MKRGAISVAMTLFLSTAGASFSAQVSLIKIDGAIGPATASYIARSIAVAEERNDECLILQLDTPGGLVSSTEDIVKSFYAARLPVAVYVAPSGASATSAGTFITLAADIAAMAPHTRIGAAHPVALGMGSEASTNEVMSAKAENDLASAIKNIAEKRSRNVDWAVSAVRQSVSITSEEALEQKVIDLIATDLPDLLAAIDGREFDGKNLATAGATIVEIPMLAREKVFQLLWRPEVMFILMLIAIYGIIGELSNPGAILPGVVGAIALILVLYMAAILPVNIAGFALIALAIALFVTDAFAPTHGILTAGGIISFCLGALMLFNKAEPAFRLSLAYIIAGAVVTAAFFVFVAGAGLRAQMLPVRAGRESMPGLIARVITRVDSNGGKVFVEGEYWNAVSESPIDPGATVEVLAVEGLTLKVKPKGK